MHPLSRFLTFIRFSHTVFALPFALGSMVVAAHGWPGWRLFMWWWFSARYMASRVL